MWGGSGAWELAAWVAKKASGKGGGWGWGQASDVGPCRGPGSWIQAPGMWSAAMALARGHCGLWFLAAPGSMVPACPCCSLGWSSLHPVPSRLPP